MPKIHARNASVYIEDSSGASQPISSDLNSAELSYSADAPDVTGFGDNTRQRLTEGLIEWELAVEGFVITPCTTGATCLLFPLVACPTFVQFGPGGSTSGSAKFTGSAILTEYNESYGVEDAATFSATFVSRSGSLSASTW